MSGCSSDELRCNLSARVSTGKKKMSACVSTGKKKMSSFSLSIHVIKLSHRDSKKVVRAFSSKRHCASFLVVDFPAARHGSIQIVVHELFRAVARKLDDEKASFRLW